jgi:hypothetical protein
MQLQEPSVALLRLIQWFPLFDNILLRRSFTPSIVNTLQQRTYPALLPRISGQHAPYATKP